MTPARTHAPAGDRAALKRDFNDRIENLRLESKRGDAEASFKLACLLEDGLVDRHGRRLIAAAPAKAVVAYKRAVELGDLDALNNLGVCYNTGRGVRRDADRALLCYSRLWKARRCCLAANNIATVHRDPGDFGRAVRWWRKAIRSGDESAISDLGYCLYYGIGVRRDVAQALSAFKRACDLYYISDFEREEALYHQAVIYLDRDAGRYRSKARALLDRANVDDDYPAARALVAQIDRNTDLVPCRCRRGWNLTVPGQARCVLHRLGQFKNGRKQS